VPVLVTVGETVGDGETVSEGDTDCVWPDCVADGVCDGV
jgi:hypothetical protein